MSDLDELLKEELKDPEFAKAWEETEAEYIEKEKQIQNEIDKSGNE